MLLWLLDLDIKKAFDCVHHKILVTKLQRYFNFSQNSSDLLESYLSNRAQAMKSNGHVSSLANLSTGVPQGSVLGPLLFIIFINDLMEIDHCYLFADDCLLMTYGSRMEESAANMERLINIASKWYDKNLLVLNATKTDVMTITNHKTGKPPDIALKDITIKQSRKIKYLGVIIDDRLNFKLNINKIKQKVYPIITNFERNRKYISPDLAALWYTGLIRPHLEYCAPLTFSTNLSNREVLLKIENRCIKIIDFWKPKSETRQQFDIPELTLRIKYLYLLSYYKLINNLVPIIDADLLPERLCSNTRLATGIGFRLALKSHRFSINNYGAHFYNNLPISIKTLSSLKVFKVALRRQILSECSH